MMIDHVCMKKRNRHPGRPRGLGWLNLVWKHVVHRRGKENRHHHIHQLASPFLAQRFIFLNGSIEFQEQLIDCGSFIVVAAAVVVVVIVAVLRAVAHGRVVKRESAGWNNRCIHSKLL
jgi:hypothetical protein